MCVSINSRRILSSLKFIDKLNEARNTISLFWQEGNNWKNTTEDSIRRFRGSFFPSVRRQDRKGLTCIYRENGQDPASNRSMPWWPRITYHGLGEARPIGFVGNCREILSCTRDYYSLSLFEETLELRKKREEKIWKNWQTRSEKSTVSRETDRPLTQQSLLRWSSVYDDARHSFHIIRFRSACAVLKKENRVSGTCTRIYQFYVQILTKKK